MSFAGTPLGQGRRLDHHTFLGKPQSQRLNSHTSYAYGAPALGARSPPKPPRSDDQNEPAPARKLKQHNSNSQDLDPEKWSVKDTSVNIAAAFHQAASDSMQSHNSAWASGLTRTTNPVPRSTSVEYESQSQSTSARRLAAPPGRLNSRSNANTSRAKPLSKNQSIRHVPDSEGEQDPPPEQNGRGKSPFDQVIGAAKRAIINAPVAAATYYVRQRSQEPDEPVAVNGSYDYSAEERDIQNQSKRAAAAASHKRNRMSMDNKAYKPSTSDLDDSDEDFTDDDGKKRRRKKKKKDAVGGPLTSLPVAGYDKRKKKAKKGSKGNADEVENGSDSDSRGTDRQSAQRGSIPPSRHSVQPELNADTSFEDAEQGLHSIPEVDDEDIAAVKAPPRPRSRSRSRGPPGAPRSRFNPGALLGTVAWTLFLVFGKTFGTTADVMLVRPARFLARSPIAPLFKYAFLALLVLLASRAIPDFGVRIPWGSDKVFHAPDIPAATVAEIAERLQRIEVELSGLSLDSKRTRGKIDEDARLNAELAGKVGVLETRVERETARSHEAEAASRDAASAGIRAVSKDVEALQALIQAFQQQQHQTGATVGSDDEARAKLKAFEERLGSMEGGVRDALDLAKKGAASGPATGAAWWSKSGSKSGLTIKSSDGQDVTAVISDLVNKAVGMYGKDNLGRADFALHSSGAQVIPSLTSDTLELRPSTIRGKVVGYITGNGFMIGRPPVTALHHDPHDGHCWPFAGTQGHLGVNLAQRVYIEDITIDHVAHEVATNSRTSAPRDMDVWALVEGEDNIAKLKAWRADKAERREKGESVEEEPMRPKQLTRRSLPRDYEYIHIASFQYDLHSPNNIQTFPVDPEVRALGIDFGVVVLMVQNNWGADAYTCLYRFRVHGQMMQDPTIQSSPRESSS